MNLRIWLRKSIWRALLRLFPIALLASLADAGLLYGVKFFVKIISGTSSLSVLYWSAAVFSLIFLRFGFLFRRGRVASDILCRVEAVLRAWFSRRLRSLHPRYFHAPDCDARLQAAYDATHVIPVSGEALVQTLQAVLQILIFFPVLFYLSMPLTLLLVFVVVPIVAFVQRKLHSMGPAVERRMSAEGAFRSELSSAEHLYRSWSGRGERSAVGRNLFSRVRGLLSLGLQVEYRKAGLSQTMEALSLVAMVAVLTFCGWMIGRGSLQPAGLVLYCSALFLCYKPVKECTRFAPQLRIAKSAWNLLLELERYPSRPERPENDCDAFALQNLTFRYAGMDRDVFKNKNGRIVPEAREHLLLYGPNGVGKSTLLRLAARLEEPDSGSVALPGKLSGEGVFLVSQEIYLPPLSLLRHALVPRRGTPEMERFLDVAGVDKLLFKEGYSGGEKSRLALAWALASPAKTVLLDEPFAFIARADRSPILSAFLDAADAFGKWVLLASHEPLDDRAALRFAKVEVTA